MDQLGSTGLALAQGLKKVCLCLVLRINGSSYLLFSLCSPGSSFLFLFPILFVMLYVQYTTSSG